MKLSPVTSVAPIGGPQITPVARVKVTKTVGKQPAHLPQLQAMLSQPRRTNTLEVLDLGQRPPPGETPRMQAALSLVLLFLALATTSAPLFVSVIVSEEFTDNSGILVAKNGSFAKAYFLGTGFLSAFGTALQSNVSAVDWFPQPKDTNFLGFPFLKQSDYSSQGACAVLDGTNPSAPECVLMTGHQGGVSSYGLCRNGSEFISIHYIAALVTPADIVGPVTTGAWIENTREVATVGLLSPPECNTGTNTVTIYPNVTDIRQLSGPFVRSIRGATVQFFDAMNLPKAVRDRVFYLVAKSGERQGIVVPNKKRQSFDDVIAQNSFGSVLADKLTVAAPFPGSKHLYFTLHRVAAVTIWLPRLQYTLAVGAQTLLLLVYLLVISLRNSARDTSHFVQQVLRLPTFCVMSIQLVYVLYYQLFVIAYCHQYDALSHAYTSKVVYVVGVVYILLHQLDVRSAVTLWPKMANNDSFYFARILWMLAALAVVVWSLTQGDPARYAVRTSSSCPLGAAECNTSSFLLFQHWVCIGVLAFHPVVYGVIQWLHWHTNRQEYTRDGRRPDQLTTFEVYGCGSRLADSYYYHTLVSRQAAGGTTAGEGKEDSVPTQYLTCAMAVRDEGFVMVGGCHALIRAKDLYLVALVRCLPSWATQRLNLSMVVAYIEEDGRLTPMHRVSYGALGQFARRWDFRISYPDIG